MRSILVLLASGSLGACGSGGELGGDAGAVIVPPHDAGRTADAGSTTDAGPSCGDGIWSSDEACDDGNLESGDGCSDGCTLETRCGDGFDEGDEACDDGNSRDGDGCSAACSVEEGWVCEETTPTVCHSELCGDGDITAPETCDDDNADSGDGCSASCVVEEGWTCDTDHRGCLPICGDGLIRGAEECDDANVASGDGCEGFACAIERDWTCEGEPSVCTRPDCGNGDRGGDEECDDGANDDGDGCSATCTIEAGYECDEGPGSASLCLTTECRACLTAYSEYPANPSGEGDGDGAWFAHVNLCWGLPAWPPYDDPTLFYGPLPADEAERCADLLVCAIRTRCASWVMMTCYCGEVDSWACETGATPPAGACAAEYLALHEGEDPAELYERLGWYEYGLAFSLAQGMEIVCAEECAP